MYKILLRSLILILLMFELSSCITARKVNYMQEPDKVIPSYKESAVYEDYKLKVGDKLFIKVYSTQEETNTLFNGQSNQAMMSTGASNTAQSDLYSYTVEQNGCIKFPLVGEVKVIGQTLREASVTLEQATATLERAFEPSFLVNSVEVRLLNRNFCIIGTGSTGYYPIVREKINIFQAMAMAGDAGTYADRGKIRIIRETEQGTIIKTFDLRTKTIINSEFYYIEPNDIIYIQRLDEQFFSIVNFPTFLATTISTISMATFLVNLLMGKGK